VKFKESQSTQNNQSHELDEENPAPELLITSPTGDKYSIFLKESPIYLGRSPNISLSFPEDEELSRRHLVFEKERNQWFIKNLASKNGTFVNGNMIRERHHLKPGDKITASLVNMEFSVPISVEKRVNFKQQNEETLVLSTKTTSLKDVLSSGYSNRQLLPDVSNESRIDPLLAFLRASKELEVSRPLSELFRITLDHSMEAIGAERGVLLVLDEGNRLVIQALHGTELRISTTVRDKVLKDKASLLVHDVQQDEYLRDSQTILDQGVHSLIAVPLQTENHVIGLMYLDSKEKQRKFSIEDLNLLTAMAYVSCVQIDRERWEIQRRMLVAENVASLGRLAAALSHEFNTPLGALKCTVDTLLRAASKRDSASLEEKSRLEKVQADLQESLDASLKRMQEVIQRIQRFTNLDRSEIQAVDINELISDVLTLAGAPKVEIKLSSEPIPKVFCHRQSMNSVFSSLLHYSLTAHKKESKDHKIEISLSASGEIVEVIIKDNSRGLSSEDARHLFDPRFEIVEGRVSAGNWSLFTARQVIQQQGGEIRVSSELDKGTTFVVIIPSKSLELPDNS